MAELIIGAMLTGFILAGSILLHQEAWGRGPFSDE